MKKKIISVSIALVLAFSILSVSFVPKASSIAEISDCEPIDVGPRLRDSTVPVDMSNAPTGPGHHSPYFEVGDVWYWFTYDDYYGYVTFDTYQLRAIGDVCEIWVQVPPEGDWSFPPETPPKPNPTNPPIVTQEQIDYILEEFETNIYPTDTGYFGVPDFHDGSNDAWGYGYWYEETGRSVIQISNIRDAHYWTDYPYYIAGFYWGLYEYYFDRNIINIDCYDWEHRVGPEGTEWIPGEYVTRPYLYEGVVAHEYQHLIHADYNPGDPSFMNEACSTFAEILCGYGADWSSINSYMYTPDNSLTIWGDQGDINILADYGAAQLWATYLNDHYGEEFLGYFVQAGIPGIDGINAALEYFGYRERFDDVYHDWRLANLIRSDFPGCDKYNYKTIDITEADPIFTHEISGLPVDWTKGTDFGTTKTNLNYDTLISKVGPYGSDYIVFEDWKKIGKIYFDGDDSATYAWTLTDYGWWPGSGNLIDLQLVGQAYVDPADPTLTLVTSYSIEEYWDFGFVQVSTDGGQTWTSLENEYTTYDYYTDVQAIIDNLPGLTGFSPDWPDSTTMTFDLTGYEGQTVMIGFRYMTDEYTNWDGWFISSAGVSGIPLELEPVYIVVGEADFQVTIVYAFEIDGCTVYIPLDMWLNDKTERGSMLAYTNSIDAIMVVSPTMQEGFVDYAFKVTPLKIPKCRGRMVESPGTSTMPVWKTETDGEYLWAKGY